MTKLDNTEADLKKKRCLYKKACTLSKKKRLTNLQKDQLQKVHVIHTTCYDEYFLFSVVSEDISCNFLTLQEL